MSSITQKQSDVLGRENELTKDELNLAEYPLTLMAHRIPKIKKPDGKLEPVKTLGKLTRLRPPHKEECCVTAQGWRGREETRPPRHADSFAPAYRPERPLRLRAGGRQRLATARRAAADRHAARCASRGLCSGVRPSTLYALVSGKRGDGQQGFPRRTEVPPR